MLGLITGDHPRHKYLANKLINLNLVKFWVIETRESFIPDSKNIENSDIRNLYDLHFTKREESEQFWFKQDSSSETDVPTLVVGENQQNSSNVKKFISDYNFHTLLSYGCHILDNEIIETSNFNSFNVHGGLSPWYRGIITHFWPSYNLEPDLTGVTLHKLTKKIDAGDIVHQTQADLIKGDGLHMLAGRTVAKFSDEVVNVLSKIVEIEESTNGYKQIHSGRLWTGNMWRPEHLLVVYKHFEDKVVDYCIDNNIKSHIRDKDLVNYDI